MARYQHAGRTYEAGARVVAETLRTDGSLFTPGRPIWTLANLRDLENRFVLNADMRSDTRFEEKVAAQLNGAPTATVQLMAELLYVYALPARYNISGTRKRQLVMFILGLSANVPSIPPELDAALDDGVASGGSAFSVARPGIIGQMIRDAIRLRELPWDERQRVIADPWAFKAFLAMVPVEERGQYARESLLHLAFPDHFERVMSQSMKWQLAGTLATLAGDDPDVDRRLWAIRERVTPRYGSDFDWFETDGPRALWGRFDHPWTGFLYWGGRFARHRDFDADERDYKLTVAAHMAAARDALRSGSGDWPALLKRAFGSPNNLTNFRTHEPLVKWAQEQVPAAGEALLACWADDLDAPARVDAAIEAVSPVLERGDGSRANLASVLLMGVDATSYPPYREDSLRTALRLAGVDAPAGLPAADRYRRALAFFDDIVTRAGHAGIPLRDRLDAQSVAWCLATTDPDTNRLCAEWTVEEKAAFRRWQVEAKSGTPQVADDDTVVDGLADAGAGPAAAADGDPLAALADELLLDPAEVREIAAILHDKKQVVFYGPPGTGKTYVARKLATVIAGGADQAVRLVQFHPSYAYEDFVEGFRPAADGQGFTLRHGPFRQIAEAARNDPHRTHVLVIDELNRANVAKVLGELYFLLEYRDAAIDLQYSGTGFTLPKNLRIIATMNTADRSIALLDAALRRRFAFIPFFPDRPPVRDLLRRWLERNRPDMSWVADVVDEANRRLGFPDGAIGPSFFMLKELDSMRMVRIWRHEVLPYIEERFLDDPERIRDFDLAVLRGTAPTPAPDSAPGEVSNRPATIDDAD